jgi:hypothetical protein
MTHRIEVTANNEAEIFNDVDGQPATTVPFIRQPNWPNQTPWANADEARMWATQFVESIENESAPFPQNGPNEDRQPKPTAEEIEAMRAQFEASRNPQAPQA